MAPSFPTLKPKEVLKALQRAGFYIHHQTGSHIVLKHPSQASKRVVLPYHNKDLKRGTLQGKGKRGGVRVIYYFYNDRNPVLLFIVFGKNERSDLTEKEKNTLYRIVREIKKEMKS